MIGVDIDRLLIVAGGVLVVLVVLSGFVSVVHWQADLFATEQNVESADVVTAGELPEECHRFAQSLADSRNVSIKEFRVEIGPISVLLRNTPTTGWEVGDSSCSKLLAFQNNFHVQDQAYNIEGRYTGSALHRTSLVRYGQLLGGLVGIGMVCVGYTRIRPSD